MPQGEEDWNEITMSRDERRKRMLRFAKKAKLGVQQRMHQHINKGEFFKTGNLEPGRLYYMATAHEFFGAQIRGYYFIQMVDCNGKRCPLFLTRVTNGGRGPNSDKSKWFLGQVSHLLVSSRAESNNAFVSLAQAVVLVPPPDGYIFAQESNELLQEGLHEKLNHLLESHQQLLGAACQYFRDTYPVLYTHHLLREHSRPVLEAAPSDPCTNSECGTVKGIEHDAFKNGMSISSRNSSDRSSHVRGASCSSSASSGSNSSASSGSSSSIGGRKAKKNFKKFCQAATGKTRHFSPRDFPLQGLVPWGLEQQDRK